ncbi:MAG: DUF1761 domain-containing protein [Pseudomonadota bacterium]
MIYIVINGLPILAAAAAAFVFGAIYYGVLGRPWMAAAGLSEDDIKGPSGRPSPWPFVISFLAEIWIAAIIAGALILAPPEAGAWTMAFGTAFILWIGFVLPVMLVNHRYEGRPLALTIINSGHWLGVFMVQVSVLQAIGLQPPAV